MKFDLKFGWMGYDLGNDWGDFDFILDQMKFDLLFGTYIIWIDMIDRFSEMTRSHESWKVDMGVMIFQLEGHILYNIINAYPSHVYFGLWSRANSWWWNWVNSLILLSRRSLGSHFNHWAILCFWIFKVFKWNYAPKGMTNMTLREEG